MDPTLADALTKLVVGASGSLGGKLTGLLWHAARRDRRGVANPQAHVDLQEIENRLVGISLSNLPLRAPLASIYEFVTSPVVKTFTEQLILINFAGARTSLDRAIREEFHASFLAYIGSVNDLATRPDDTDAVSDDADVLFAALSDLAEAAVGVLRERGYRLNDEAVQHLHYLILELYASSIERNTRLLSSLRPDNLKNNDDFLRRLTDQVSFRYRYIEPPDFERIVRIPIEEMYVSPSLSEGVQPDLYAATELNLTNFAAKVYRTVVLGDPGGGKSTLSAFLSRTIGAKTFRQDIFEGKTPVVIVLREMKMSERGPEESVLQYIETICESKYALRPSTNAIEYALLNGRLFLIFDGLDELLDPVSRSKVVDAIEAIANLYPNTFILVTSRRINYEAAPLDPDIFEAFSLNEFDDKRIEEYAYKSFGQLTDLSDEERHRTTRAFLTESREHAAEIRSNPLVLALMCRLYRGENYIPQNIPSLYQRCANMLFFTWDARRHIKPALPFEYHIEPLMAHLANWMFETGTVAVPEGFVVTHATEYLNEWLISDPREAQAAAIAFVKYFKNRLWVFSEVGLTNQGESLYAFTHRTFLEYFAGMHLSTNATSSTDLAEMLLPRLEYNEWSVVAQVAVYLRAKAEVRAPDEIIQVLLDAPQANADVLSFIVRLLGFIAPRPETLTRIIHATLNLMIQTDYQNDRQWELMISLARARPDNRPGITRNILNYANNALAEPKDRAISAIGSILQLPTVLAASVIGDATYIEALLAFWQDVADAVVDLVGSSIREWVRADERLMIPAWQSGVLVLHDFVLMRGLAEIFRRERHSERRLVTPSSRPDSDLPDQEIDLSAQRGEWDFELVPIFPDLFVELARSPTYLTRALEEWHDVAISLPTPWFERGWMSMPLLDTYMLADYRGSKKAFSSIALILAAFFEAWDSREINPLSSGENIIGASLGDMDGFKDVFMARASTLGLEDISQLLDRLSDLATDECRDLLKDWAMGRVNLCSTLPAGLMGAAGARRLASSLPRPT